MKIFFSMYSPGVHFSCISKDHVSSFSNTDKYMIIRGRYIQDCEWHRGINREFKITRTATATGTSLNKRFNEQNNGCARAL